MRPRTLALALTTVLTVTATAAAQYPAGPEGGRHHGSWGRGTGFRGNMAPPDPVVLDGPPAADSLARIVSLNDSQRTRYAGLRDRFMENTKAQRDSLQSARQTMRDAFENGDRDAARRQADELRHLRDGLAHQQEVFDGTLKEFLGKDQWKQYQAWREQQRQAKGRHRGRRPDDESGAPPS